MRRGCLIFVAIAVCAAVARAAPSDPPPAPPPNTGEVRRHAPNEDVRKSAPNEPNKNARPSDCDPSDRPRFPAPWPSREDFAWMFEPAQGPHVGLGQPLVNASWLYRPLSIGAFLGPVTGNELSDSVEGDASLLMGFRAGWDVEAFWGLEARLGFANPKLQDEATGRDYDEGDFVLWDVNVLCYPWGESRLRPYASIGLGMAKFSFTDLDTLPYRDDVMSLPLGVGLKYRCTPWMAARFDITDTISIAGDTTGTLNNFTFTFGMEYRFGHHQTFYWPWQSGGW
jgi:hypothetical protein